MDSPQSVVSPLKTSLPDSENRHTNLYAEKPSLLPREINSETKKISEEDSLGDLEVYIHQARDIHNICIYQKQDVYAKLCLTSDPDKSVSTKIINGGGANPVFNENLRLNVGKIDSSLKCEIWMLSRVRNYLEDQLLGFTLVPISEILINNGKLEREFSLSSTDLFHSPAGFVQLSVSYVGSPPEVIPIPPPHKSDQDSITTKDSESLDKIEFPDPKVANENHQMVEEYFGMPCNNNVESQSSDSLVSSDTENQVSSEVEDSRSSRLSPKVEDSPPSSEASAPLSCESSKIPKDSESLTEEPNSEKSKAPPKPVVRVDFEPESKVVQQDIVDMYMKSMQQFTESLAKMKLPMDFENGPTSSENSTTSEQKTPGSKNSGSRVFYGSRAFF